MKKGFQVLVISSIVTFQLYSQDCNTVQNLSPLQQNEIANIIPQLESALFQEDLNAIDSLSLVLKTIFGVEGGIPDALESYTSLMNDVVWLDYSNSIQLSRQLIGADSLMYVDLWKVAKGMNPPLYQAHSIFLRASAEIASGLLKIAHFENDQTRKSLYENWAIRALDSLSTMQLPNGAFPFPDLRTYNDPVFTPIIQNFILSCGADSVNVLQNGWIVDDKASGEFKFDAGIIANAYYEAYFYTGIERFKSIAISIGDYLKPLKFNLNYNYNSFVSLGLTRAYQLTNDESYLDRAIQNIRFSVQPGQLSNGRWLDGHNANSRYHSIMVQNCAPTQVYIPASNPYKQNVKQMTHLAIKNLLDYSYTCNAATGFRWLIKSYRLDSEIVSASLKDSISDLIGKHIKQAANFGSFLDVPTMGDYLELIDPNLNTLDEAINEHIQLFPNPSQELIHISITGPNSESINVILYDLNGKMIPAPLISDHQTSLTSFCFDLCNTRPGMYIAEIHMGTSIFRQKFIHQ